MTFLGDGAFSAGDVHEGLNLAGVLAVPAVFVIQSNRIAYSTPTERQMLNTDLAARIEGGWSIPAERVDGTDALAAFEAMRAAVERARAGAGPQAVVATSLRMDGHAAHDDGRYMDAAVRAAFAETRDPVERLHARLVLDGMPEDEVGALREAAAREVSEAVAEAEGAPAPDPASLTDGVYATPIA